MMTINIMQKRTGEPPISLLPGSNPRENSTGTGNVSPVQMEPAPQKTYTGTGNFSPVQMEPTLQENSTGTGNFSPVQVEPAAYPAGDSTGMGQKLTKLLNQIIRRLFVFSLLGSVCLTIHLCKLIVLHSN